MSERRELFLADFLAGDLLPGDVLATGDRVTRVSLTKEPGGQMIVEVTQRNGGETTYDYPADSIFYDVTRRVD